MADEVPDFKRTQDVRRWLDTRPGSLARVLALRAASRSLAYFSPTDVEDLDVSGFQRALFAASSAWHRALFTFADGSDLAEANAIAAGARATESRDDRIEAAKYAARCGVDGDWVLIVRDAALAIDHAGHAAAAFRWPEGDRARRDASRDEAAAVAADALRSEQGESTDLALISPLWRTDAGEQALPNWFSEAWQRLRVALNDRAKEGWQVWIDWYEARLRGDPPDWERERAYILDLEDFWTQGPAAANAEIARRLEEIDARRLRELFARAGWPEDPDSILARLARGERPTVDAAQAQAALAAFSAEAANLRATLAAAGDVTPGIGHNRPPEQARLTEPEREDTGDALNNLAAEFEKPEPEPAEVARQTRRLAAVYDGLARRAGVFETNLWAGAGAATGGAAAVGLGTLAATHGPAVLGALGQVIDAAMTWLGAGPSSAGPGVAPPPALPPPTLSI